jgi:translation initiation factor IF-1
VDGIVSKLLPTTMYRVQRENGHEILAPMSGKIRKHFIKITTGDRVQVETPPCDLTKGRIPNRHRNGSAGFRLPADKKPLFGRRGCPSTGTSLRQRSHGRHGSKKPGWRGKHNPRAGRGCPGQPGGGGNHLLAGHGNWRRMAWNVKKKRVATFALSRFRQIATTGADLHAPGRV